MSDYVVVKLISGETVMATFEGEDDKFIKINYPIQIKTTIIPEIHRESISAAPFCQFSESSSFTLEKSHIIYIKKLHKQFISHYKNFIKTYDEALIPTTRQSIQEALQEADDELTIEEIQKRLDLLESIASSAGEEVDEEDLISFIEGNDTVH